MSLKELKKRFQHRCFPVDIAKFFRTAILNFICQWLLLDLQKSNRERIESYRSKLESRKVVLTKMSSNKRSGNNLSDENEKVSKKIRCSLTGYSEKSTADFLKKISGHPCKEDWRRWWKIRIPYKQCLINWTFINTANELLEKEPHHISHVCHKFWSISKYFPYIWFSKLFFQIARSSGFLIELK